MSAGPDEAREGLNTLLGYTKEDDIAKKRYNNIIEELSGTHYTTEDGTEVPVNIPDILSHVAIESNNFRAGSQVGGPAKTIWGLEGPSYNKVKDFLYPDGRIKEGRGQEFIDAYVTEIIRNGSSFIRGRMGRVIGDNLSKNDVNQLRKDYPNYTFTVKTRRTNNGSYKQIDYRTAFPKTKLTEEQQQQQENQADRKDKWERYLKCLQYNVPGKFILFRDCWSSGGIGADEVFMKGQPWIQRLWDDKPGTRDTRALDALQKIHDERNKDRKAMDQARYMVDRTNEKVKAAEWLMNEDFGALKYRYYPYYGKAKLFSFISSVVPSPSQPLFSDLNLAFSLAENIDKKNRSKPKEITYTNHTIKSGDTLGGIANKYGVSIETLKKDNNITDPNKIKEGQVLKIRQSK